MQIRRDVMAQEREETAYCKGLVASFQNIKVHGMLIVEVAQEGDHTIDGYQEEDADDVSLLVGFEVVRCVGENEEDADACRYEAKDGA